MASLEVCKALPKTTWLICSGLTPERLMASFEATTPKSIAVRSFKELQNSPKGVLAPSKITISFILPPQNHLCNISFLKPSCQSNYQQKIFKLRIFLKYKIFLNLLQIGVYIKPTTTP